MLKRLLAFLAGLSAVLPVAYAQQSLLERGFDLALGQVCPSGALNCPVLDFLLGFGVIFSALFATINAVESFTKSEESKKAMGVFAILAAFGAAFFIWQQQIPFTAYVSAGAIIIAALYLVLGVINVVLKIREGQWTVTAIAAAISLAMIALGFILFNFDQKEIGAIIILIGIIILVIAGLVMAYRYLSGQPTPTFGGGGGGLPALLGLGPAPPPTPTPVGPFYLPVTPPGPLVVAPPVVPVVPPVVHPPPIIPPPPVIPPIIPPIVPHIVPPIVPPVVTHTHPISFFPPPVTPTIIPPPITPRPLPPTRMPVTPTRLIPPTGGRPISPFGTTPFSPQEQPAYFRRPPIIRTPWSRAPPGGPPGIPQGAQPIGGRGLPALLPGQVPIFSRPGGPTVPMAMPRVPVMSVGGAPIPMGGPRQLPMLPERAGSGLAMPTAGPPGAPRAGAEAIKDLLKAMKDLSYEDLMISATENQFDRLIARFRDAADKAIKGKNPSAGTAAYKDALEKLLQYFGMEERTDRQEALLSRTIWSLLSQAREYVERGWYKGYRAMPWINKAIAETESLMRLELDVQHRLHTIENLVAQTEKGIAWIQKPDEQTLRLLEENLEGLRSYIKQEEKLLKSLRALISSTEKMLEESR